MSLHEGKVALVTGGARGVGRAEAIALAKAGAAVVVNDIGVRLDGSAATASPAQEVVAEIHALGGRAIVSSRDVADWDDAKAMVDEALEAFGRLDVVVCNAGILRDRVFVNLSADDWNAVLRVHLNGTAAVAHAACNHWRARAKAGGQRSSGSLILTSSQAGLYGNVGQANYAAAKAGIIGLSLTIAHEAPRYGVRCNVVCPRARTRMTESAFGTIESDADFDEWDPDNVGQFVAALSSDSFAEVNGRVFVVGAGEVRVLAAPAMELEIRQNESWTADRFAVVLAAAFDGHDLSVPTLPVNKPNTRVGGEV